MLMIDKAQIGIDSIALHWQINLPLLVNINKPMVDISDAAQSEDDTFESPLGDEKLRVWDPSADTNFWRDVGRLIWWEMIMDGLPN